MNPRCEITIVSGDKPPRRCGQEGYKHTHWWGRANAVWICKHHWQFRLKKGDLPAERQFFSYKMLAGEE
jgi:hypothetical protein